MTDIAPLPAHLVRAEKTARAFEDESDPFVRGAWVTRIDREDRGAPTVTKKAAALAAVLRALPIYVNRDTVLQGPVYRRRRVHGGIGDHDAWRIKAFFPERFGYDPSWAIPEQIKSELSYWSHAGTIVRQDRNEYRRAYSYLSEFGLANPNGFHNGHTLPDHGILLEHGVDALRRRIARRLSVANEGERVQLSAMDRCLDALSQHMHRWADELRRAVGTDGSGAGLLRAAERFSRLAHEPAASFADALQLLVVSNTLDVLDNPGDAASLGRVDQILYPYYRADTHAGRLDRRAAFELVCDFLIHTWTVQDSKNMTIGGVTPDGADGTNALSYLFLEGVEATRMACDMSVRLSSRTPSSFRELVARVVRIGLGRPSVFNDDVVVPGLIDHGVAVEDARDYAPLGCAEVMIPGRTAARTMSMGLNAAKILELVVSGGRCTVTGGEVWDDVPDSYGSFEALLAETSKRIHLVVRQGAEIIRRDEELEPEMAPAPWLTVLSRGGVDDGRDVTAGQPAYDLVGVTLDGVADAVNSLVVLREILFEDPSTFGMSELRRALADDFRGHEAFRRRVLERTPRFGQDSDVVHETTRWLTDCYAHAWEGERTRYGGRFLPMIFGVTTSIVHGRVPKTGALPSGRRRADMLAGSLRPSTAGKQGSIVELLHGVSAVDFRKFPGGVSNVQELDPSHFEGSYGVWRLRALIDSFFEMGGMELGLNFIDLATLEDARKHPENHQNLMVRVFGMSAHFVDLSPELQQIVLDRVAAAARRG